MNGGQATHDRVIVNPDVAGERAIVRKDNRILNDAIVANMTIGEKVPSIRNLRLAIAPGAAIDGHEFAKSIFVTDFKISRFACVL